MNLIEHSRGIVKEMSASLPSALDAASVSVTAKLPFKALALRGALIHRASELADTALDLHDGRRFVSTAIMVRALMETTGLLYSLHKKLSEAVESKTIGDLDNFLMGGLVGDRTEEKEFPSPNALTGIGHITKGEGDVEPSFREMYDWLSEFAHPNWYGVAGAYSDIDEANRLVTFGRRRDPREWAFLEAPLARSLSLFYDCYKNISALLPAFTELCEEEVRGRAV